MRNNLINNLLGFSTYDMNVEIHRHSAVQIVFAQDYRFDSCISKTNYNGIYGFIIKPQIEHICTNVKGCLTVLNIEPDSNVGIYINELFNTKKNNHIIYEREELLEIFGIQTIKKNKNIIPTLISFLCGKKVDKSLDPRILRALNIVRENSEKRLTNSKISQEVFLSPSRFSALFKNEVGSSFSKFLLWFRMRKAIYLLLSQPEKTITEIALLTGFYDSSNFTKAMYQLVGVKPIVFRKNSNLIQFL